MSRTIGIFQITIVIWKIFQLQHNKKDKILVYPADPKTRFNINIHVSDAKAIFEQLWQK